MTACVRDTPSQTARRTMRARIRGHITGQIDQAGVSWTLVQVTPPLRLFASRNPTVQALYQVKINKVIFQSETVLKFAQKIEL